MDRRLALLQEVAAAKNLGSIAVGKLLNVALTDATSAKRAALRAALVVAAPQATIDVSIAHNTKRITGVHHDYELVVTLKNVGTRRLDDWEIEIEFPTPLLDGTIYAMKVDERSGPDVTVFRYVGARVNKALRPGDSQVIRIGYFVNDAIYQRRDELFGAVARARVLVDGEIVFTRERTIAELQNF